jgi:hypothetical protein
MTINIILNFSFLFASLLFIAKDYGYIVNSGIFTMLIFYYKDYLLIVIRNKKTDEYDFAAFRGLSSFEEYDTTSLAFIICGLLKIHDDETRKDIIDQISKYRRMSLPEKVFRQIMTEIIGSGAFIRNLGGTIFTNPFKIPKQILNYIIPPVANMMT